jgi:hypothetical protein
MKDPVNTANSFEILKDQQVTGWDMCFQGQDNLKQTTGIPTF